MNAPWTYWFELGVFTAGLYEEGYAWVDAHEGNLPMRDRFGNLVIADYSAIQKVSLPSAWGRIPVGLMSLLSWLEIEQAALFRYGYLHHGRYLAFLILDQLRTRFGITAFRGVAEVDYRAQGIDGSPDLGSVLRRDAAWRKRRSNYDVGDLKRLAIPGVEAWAERRCGIEAVNIREADEYYFERRLVVAMAHRHLADVIQVLLNLRRLYESRQQAAKAYGVALYCRRLCDRWSEKIPADWQDCVSAELEQTLTTTDEQIVQDLSRIPEVHHIFHWIWCLDDYVTGELSWHQ